jgi:glycosyltransferase involved in cell wall biosynthesis
LKVPISVVIPAYNAEKFIRQAIENVREQTVKVSEIVVVDNNSTDRTRQIAEELGACVVEEKKQNIAAARNRGIIESGGDWIALLDADDFWKKRKIEYQWEAVRACPDAGMVSCDFGFLVENRDLRIKQKKLWEKWDAIENRVTVNPYCSYFPKVTIDLLKKFTVHTSTVVLRRDVFSELGFFDEALVPQEDVEFFLRILGRYPLAIVHKRLSYYRQHETNTTRDRETTGSAVFQVANRLGRSPEKYPPGTAEHYLASAKSFFLQKARKLALEEKQSLSL